MEDERIKSCVERRTDNNRMIFTTAYYQVNQEVYLKKDKMVYNNDDNCDNKKIATNNVYWYETKYFAHIIPFNHLSTFFGSSFPFLQMKPSLKEVS